MTIKSKYPNIAASDWSGYTWQSSSGGINSSSARGPTWLPLETDRLRYRHIFADVKRVLQFTDVCEIKRNTGPLAATRKRKEIQTKRNVPSQGRAKLHNWQIYLFDESTGFRLVLAHQAEVLKSKHRILFDLRPDSTQTFEKKSKRKSHSFFSFYHLKWDLFLEHQRESLRRSSVFLFRGIFFQYYFNILKNRGSKHLVQSGILCQDV